MATITTKYPFVGSIETRQGGRKENQDNAGFIDTPLGLLIVVCDGMGGGPGGRTASLMAVDSILNVLSEISVHTPREDALKYAIEKANDIIYAKAREIPELRGMGTTVAAMLINEESAVIAHAGDTRVYQLRKGTIVFRSSDHSVVANLVRQKRITEEEARNHPQSNIVTRALGIRPSMEIEFDEVTFLRGDRFIICTDGVWGMMPQHDLVKTLSRIMGINELTTSITDEIDRNGHENGGGHDNLTLAVIDTSFDSTLKKKKKNPNNASDDSIGKELKSTHNYKSLIIALTVFVILSISFLIYLSLDQQENDLVSKRIPKQLKGSTTTTIDKRTVIVKEDDSVQMDSENNNNLVRQIPDHRIDNPFQDSIIIDSQNKEIVRHINSIVKNLDTLKTINGKNRDNAKKKKKKYINDVIKPNVKHLGDEVPEKKKKDIDDILNMLNDRKTVSSDMHGMTTKESYKHIEMIQIKVKAIQN